MSSTEVTSNDDDRQTPGAKADVNALETAEDYHLEGLKLWAIIIGVSLAVFLMALDTSIIATVRTNTLNNSAVKLMGI